MIDVEILKKLYVQDLLPVESIAERFGCSVANVKRVLKKERILRGKALQKLGIVPAWNKGLNKDSSEVLKTLSESRLGEKNPMFGKEAWNKGKTKESDTRVAQVSKKMCERELSSKHREGLSLAKSGKYRELSNNWRGGRSYINHLGYLQNRFTVEGKRWYEHRYVATKCLGRELGSEEHVHHIDRNRLNNTPENLIVLGETDHNRLHRAIDDGWVSREQQITWLKENGINFEVCNGKSN